MSAADPSPAPWPRHGGHVRVVKPAEKDAQREEDDTARDAE